MCEIVNVAHDVAYGFVQSVLLIGKSERFDWICWLRCKLCISLDSNNILPENIFPIHIRSRSFTWSSKPGAFAKFITRNTSLFVVGVPFETKVILK